MIHGAHIIVYSKHADAEEGAVGQRHDHSRAAVAASAAGPAPLGVRGQDDGRVGNRLVDLPD